MEREIIRACLKDRRAYNAVSNSGYVSEFSPRIRKVYEALEEFYGRDADVKQANEDLILNSLIDKAPKYEDSWKQIIEGAVTDDTLSAINYTHFINKAQLNVVEEKLAAALAMHAPYEHVSDLLREYSTLQNVNEKEDSGTTIFNDVAIEDIMEKVSEENKVSFSPPGLATHLGGGAVFPCHIVVFARPDAGKTTFCLAQIPTFTQAKRRVLYYGNEDPPAFILMRTLQAYCGVSLDKIKKEPRKAQEVANALGYKDVFFAFSDSGSPADLEYKIKDTKPDIVFVDQLRNLTVKSDSRVLQLEQAARDVRSLTKRYGTITFSITQAGDSAEGKLVLDMGDVDFSNTGIQGTADLMIGIGVNDQHRAAGQRVCSFPKNKLNGNRDPYVITMNERLCGVS